MWTSDPHRARGVTFDDMDLLSRFMTTDHLSEPEQSHARQTLERLEGTDMERILQAGILGSDETLKRTWNCTWTVTGSRPCWQERTGKA